MTGCEGVVCICCPAYMKLNGFGCLFCCPSLMKLNAP